MPAGVKLREAVTPVPSSNWPSSSVSQAREAMLPSTSVEVSVKVTDCPGAGEAGEMLNDACGSWFGGGGGGGPPAVSAVMRLRMKAMKRSSWVEVKPSRQASRP